MPQSPSTPRLRITFAYYVGLIVAAAFCGSPAPAEPWTGLALDASAVVLVGVAVLGRVWCSTFVAGYKDERLVTQGPYALCRHPLYVLSIIGGLGLGVATRSLVLTLITLLVLAILLSRAARGEERRLKELHGDAFMQYARATPRWWPRWRAYQVPPDMQLRTRIFWKAFLDAGSFILLYVLITTARSLREAGAFPTLLPLP